MVRKPDGVTITAPKSFALKTLNVDTRTLFRQFSYLVQQGTGLVALAKLENIPKMVATLWDTADSLKPKPEPGELAWRLVRNALTGAIAQLIDEWWCGPEVDRGQTLIAVEANMDHLSRVFGEEAVRFDLDMLKNPRRLPLLPRFERTLVEWLKIYGAPESQARARAARLTSYFVVEMDAEWREHPGLYAPLLAGLDGPGRPAAELERAWEANHNWLIRQFDQPVFEESFGLSQVYVPLRAVWMKSGKKDRAPTRYDRLAVAEDGDDRKKAVVVDLETAMIDWLKKADPQDTLRIVRGGPGSGKSTFAKHLAATLAADLERARQVRRVPGEVRVLFFPLQRFSTRGELIEAVGKALEEQSAPFASNPLRQTGFASGERPLLLIFDGLDELTKPGDLADNETRQFVTALMDSLRSWNQDKARVFALVTGRTAAIQASRELFREKEGRELEVLRFWLSERDRKVWNGCLVEDPKKLLAEDQRGTWWGRYVACKAGEAATMPEVLLAEDVVELSAEPLLLYLLVLSGYHRRQPELGAINRNTIYADLFGDVGERRHDRVGGPLAGVTDVGDQAKFEQVMEVIATAAWYGDGRTATPEDIRRACPTKLRPTLERFLEHKGGLARLIAAFYFQASESGYRPEAIEFTHKSFGEYLTARRLVNEVGRLHEALQRDDDVVGDREALDIWFQLCRHRAMDFDLLRFLRDEVLLRKQAEVAVWVGTLARLLGFALRHGLPTKPPADGVSFRTAIEHSRNAEEALLAALNACLRAVASAGEPPVGPLALFDPKDRLVAGRFIHRLRSQRDGQSIALDCLGYLDFSNQSLFSQDLLMANLSAANLSGANLSGANLRGANLSAANLSGADLSGANLSAADLSGADLSGADLSGANLSAANLSAADLSAANLRGANLSGAYLSGADLSGADLSGADLSAADLSGAYLSGAYLSGANLSGADLSGADLSGADRDDATLPSLDGEEK